MYAAVCYALRVQHLKIYNQQNLLLLAAQVEVELDAHLAAQRFPVIRRKTLLVVS